MFEASDHRSIAKQRSLLHFQEEAPGMAFWHPPGVQLCRLLEDAARTELLRHGYAEVRSPQLMRKPIWEASGHWQQFSEGIFKLEEDDGPGAALRPVNCPGHAQIYKQSVRSYRDLPLRLAEFGVVHRREPSGALQGLFRLRQFTQDDGHVFCREDQLEAELQRFCRSVVPFYRRFGFDKVRLGLSLRPERRFGDDSLWDAAEGALRAAAAEVDAAIEEQPGEGAFYGPKLEFKLEDRQGRVWQCGTIQLDFVMPERFGLSYVAADGRDRRPVMLHRALFGSVERFLGILLEHHAGRLPYWLCVEQVRVLPVGPSALAYAHDVLEALGHAGLRAQLSDAAERLNARVARVHDDAVPFALIVGDREAKARQVCLREGIERSQLPLEQAITLLKERCRE